ncbi:hypothetical protein IX39_10950 [Chryseobacterium formosense]|uniref:Uncharacterized protein n=1 Tax=Chryseobacterium formosense TaxID=236814 RepID=A0A085Z9J2_9FLAO|nr:hypothetical protein [Chryseobacterium formosense]KFF01106.1 hypothetical protein IX39_10950 [Chryseobacterium formosense]SFT42316.1 hypothetical protein SAMN05421857_0886 [Chryseobacterium formosense]
MNFTFENLDEETRALMISEINYDIDNQKLYLSKRFNDNGNKLYTKLLLDAAEFGNENTLAISLKDNNCFADKEVRNGKNGIISAKIPDTANITLADSEFNRFYIRALAQRAIASGQKLIVYRARHSDKPRLDSEDKIGSEILPEDLLKDLRENIGIDTILGLPAGPNSGLSVRLN